MHVYLYVDAYASAIVNKKADVNVHVHIYIYKSDGVCVYVSAYMFSTCKIPSMFRSLLILHSKMCYGPIDALADDPCPLDLHA